MKYMLMLHAPPGTATYASDAWAPEDVRAMTAHMRAVNRAIQDAGEWVRGHGLAPPAAARLVRAGTDGLPMTDGPFPESKEFLAGFVIVDVASPERAVELAARISAAPGPGGIPMNAPVEVRPVVGPPPVDA